MLSSITLRQFKSYKEAKLPLAPLTVLIGANASGKSNAIEAMRLLSWLAQGQKLSSIQYRVQNEDKVVRGRIDDMPYHGESSFLIGCEILAKSSISLSITISVRDDGLHVIRESMHDSKYHVPLYDVDQPSVGRNTDVGVAYNNFAKGGNKPHVICSDQFAVFTQLTSPASFKSTHKESQRVIPARASLCERTLGSMIFLDPVPASMRSYSFPSDVRLRGDGANLSSVLYNICKSEDTEKDIDNQNMDDVLQFIKSLPEQDIGSISFLTEPRGGVMVELSETFGGQERKHDASLLSDGTLRVLSIAAAMLSADEGSLVVIEEIDNGVHPSRARHLLDRILAIAKRRNLRVLLSTHNPALMDALPDSAIPDVVFCYRDMTDGSSKLVRLSDISEYPELVAQGSLGHLVTSGVLERFVKQQPKGSERTKRALQWLKSIRAGNES